MNDLEQAAEFRRCAQESLAYGEARHGPLRELAADLAATYFQMAEHLDTTSSLARAVQMPTQPQEARDMAAAIIPADPSEPAS